MPPVNPVPSPTDVDNDSTAELPVLDVAAYEATRNDPISNTDTWNLPAGTLVTATDPFEVTVRFSTTGNNLPVLQPADTDPDSLSGTHEMPAVAWASNKVERAAPTVTLETATPVAAAAEPPATPQPTVAPQPSAALVEEWRNALAAAERRVLELQERARIADAERAAAIARAAAENAQLREQLDRHLERLQTARSRRALRATERLEFEDELFRRADRIEALQRDNAAQAATLAGLRESLEAARQKVQMLEAETANLRAGIARRDAQISTLEADLATRQQRESGLRRRLDEALAATTDQVPELRAEVQRREEELRNLKAELAQARAQAADKNADLEVAEESIRQLESELRDKAGKLQEASHTVEEWRSVIAESQRSILQRDSRIQQLEADLEKRVVRPPDTAATGEEVALEGPARVLIRTDGNTDFVHVLGRRTRIGRGADNELVLETKHVSRYHAVLLAGPVHTTIEDLNSTNGVFVNGKRITRQALKDGDRVTIGRTQFRFSVRT